MACKNCGSSDTEVDGDCGDTVCTNCGTVLEDNFFLSEIQFGESGHGTANIFGQFVSHDSAGGATGYGKMCVITESREITLRKARQCITHLSHQLSFNNHCIETACNFYKLALMRHLTQGRKNTHTYAACVYMTCRTEGTCHLLIDVSDVVQICCHELGRTYRQLSQALHLNIPSIDPCLYVMRFANELEFGVKTHEVSMTAQRLVQRMIKDSIQTGRRSSGLYGAALLIAARMHDFSRTPDDIVRIVKIHQSTLRKRLIEFGDTPSSMLTLDEFMTVDLEPEEDPPAFKAACKRDRERLQNLSEHHVAKLTALQLEIDSCLEKEINGQRKRRFETIDTKHDESTFADECLFDAEDVENVENVENVDNSCYNKKQSVPTGLSPDQALLCSPNLKNLVTPRNETDVDTGELDLEGLDDDEINRYILTEVEVKHKDMMWKRLNSEYLTETKAKKEKLAKETEEERPQKKRRRKCRNPSTTTCENIGMMKHEENISSKINYDVLKTLIKSKCNDVLTNVVDETPVPVEDKSKNNLLDKFVYEQAKSLDSLIDDKVDDDADHFDDDGDDDDGDEDDIEPETEPASLANMLCNNECDDHFGSDDMY